MSLFKPSFAQKLETFHFFLKIQTTVNYTLTDDRLELFIRSGVRIAHVLIQSQMLRCVHLLRKLSHM